MQLTARCVSSLAERETHATCTVSQRRHCIGKARVHRSQIGPQSFCEKKEANTMTMRTVHQSKFHLSPHHFSLKVIMASFAMSGKLFAFQGILLPDLRRSPSLLKPWLQRAIEPETHEPALAWCCLKPIRVASQRRLWGEPQGQ